MHAPNDTWATAHFLRRSVRGIAAASRKLAIRGLPMILACLAFTLARVGMQGGVALGPATTPLPGVDAGEVLFAELNCISCHGGSEATRARLHSRSSPKLGADGLRLTPQFIRAFLTNPAREYPGTTMPDLLHGLNEKNRATQAEALTHYLVSQQSPAVSTNSTGDSTKLKRGRELFHTIGCVACHAPQEPREGVGAEVMQKLRNDSVPLTRLASKTTVEDLAAFLMDPLKARPSGRMPGFNFTLRDAQSLAVYLLREQSPGMDDRSLATHRAPGLVYQYYEAEIRQTAQLDNLTALDEGVTDRLAFPTRRRAERFGLRFFGFLKVQQAGEYTFVVSSDDGSRLFIDGKEVVNNDGEHGTEQKSGKVQLTAGEHEIQLLYFNLNADGNLRAVWQTPGSDRRNPIPASAFSHSEHAMKPLGDSTFVLDAAKAAKGKELFGSLGCAACHAPGDASFVSKNKAKPLAGLRPNRGCLADKPSARAARFALSPEQLKALRATVTARAKLAQPADPRSAIHHTLTAMNCVACHTREGAGGPAAERSDYFTTVGEADLGDEGRMPPHLSGVGNKLRPEWLREVLFNKGVSRPYMATRMPQFGEANLGHLPAALASVDGPVKPDAPVVTADAKHGRKLVGTGGLTCISCHTFAAYKSLGIPAMDLSVMSKRLTQDWFKRYLINPPSLRPGTRMPTFWPDGKSARADILGGDTDRQIAAIWAFLSSTRDVGLPDGLVQGKVELVADKEAVLYRNFLTGSPRSIGVGYPEKANLSWDANNMRLVSIWQGPFIDASRHRDGRGAGFVGPLGFNVVRLPEGAPLARLTDATKAWPEDAGKRAGYQFRGYELDDVRRPAFRYSFNGIEVEDYPVAFGTETDAYFKRTLTLRGSGADLWFRAWVGSNVTQSPDGSFTAEGKVKLKLDTRGGGRPVIRQSAGNTELLVPITFSGNQAVIVQEIVW